VPTYQFRATDTGEIFEAYMRMSELDGYLEQNPNVQRYYDGQAASIGDPVRLGLRKVDGGFKDILKRIKKNHHGSTINA
jgi:hypothetical protein